MRERRFSLPFSMLSVVIALLLLCAGARPGHAVVISMASTPDFTGVTLINGILAYSPPPSQPAGGGPTPSFSPPPLTASDPPGAVAVALPTGAAIFSDPGAIGTGNTYAAFDTVFEHLTAALTGADGATADAMRSFAPMTLAFNHRSAASDRQIAQLDDAGLAFPAALQRSGAWLRGIGSFQSARSEGAAPGYSGQSGGFLAGIDHGFTPDLTLGIAGGYGHTGLSQSDGTSGDIDTPRLIAYGLYRAGPVALEGTLGFAYDRISTVRPAGGANAGEAHNGFEKNAALQAAYPLSVGDVAVVPHLGLQYVRLDENHFTESGAGSADLTAGSTTTESLQPSIGASLLKSFAAGDGVTLIPALKASFAHELLDTARNLVLTSAAGTAVNAFGISGAHNTVIIGPAVTARLGDTLELTGDYTLTLGLGKSTAHTVIAGARAAF